MFYNNNFVVQVTKPKNHYEIFLNCNDFKKLTGDLVSGKIEFDFKDFCNQYYHIFNNNFLEIDQFRNCPIVSISFEKPSTLKLKTAGGSVCRITNLQEISKILSEMAKKFEEFAERYKEISNSLDEFEL